MHHSARRPSLPPGAAGIHSVLQGLICQYVHSSVGNHSLFFFPQGHLLSCTVHCLLWLQNMRQAAKRNVDDSDDDEDDNDEEEEGYQSELQTILESMTRRMIKCEMEDFELVSITDDV